MSFHGRVSGTRIKRALGVQAALEWAFRFEQAQLDLPLPPDITEEGFGFGLEYILLQRAVLGCKIDGGQHKIGGYTHEDAEVIAARMERARAEISHWDGYDYVLVNDDVERAAAELVSLMESQAR